LLVFGVSCLAAGAILVCTLIAVGPSAQIRDFGKRPAFP
jgi:hypothetical protein